MGADRPAESPSALGLGDPGRRVGQGNRRPGVQAGMGVRHEEAVPGCRVALLLEAARQARYLARPAHEAPRFARQRLERMAARAAATADAETVAGVSQV